MRICFFGDSFVNGTGDDDGLGWVGRIVADGAGANERICALSADYASLCESLRIPYLEVCRITMALPVWTREALAGDGAHPNRGGDAAVAQAVATWPPWLAWITWAGERA
jgi:acyl-CoA thioesterase-1